MDNGSTANHVSMSNRDRLDLTSAVDQSLHFLILIFYPQLELVSSTSKELHSNDRGLSFTFHRAIPVTMPFEVK